ncbi:hypothetical protein [Planktothrix agardhii]|uniref:hypothetical protein n=1 Tax=Planktothrix agardhii TaxID=1160 RepID=UPI000488CEE4|nr:hypothetical protein [Planktothrix agardhii]CAD0227956.1 conserved hypothetical protein [Planktothrix agardhii]CAD5978452.1 hypothetical protein NO758_04327 [Planktothrix agardhii]
MIFYVVTESHAFTMNRYLESWGRNLLPLVRPIFYEQLNKIKSLPVGTYIFSDLERLSPEEAEMASQVWEQLANSGKGIRLLNHPTGSMRRYELLRTLYEKGWNKFNVYRIIEERKPERFPVFLRGETDHAGSRSLLLETPEDLKKALAVMLESPDSREDKIITEFCDTSDENGRFRKYGAFVVGDRIFHDHLFFSDNWMLKFTDLEEKEMILEERDYMRINPHPLESELKEIAKIARIEYGRIDYSMLNGVPQIWEINTNPHILERHYLADINFNHPLIDQSFFTRRPECWTKVRISPQNLPAYQKKYQSLAIARISAQEYFSQEYEDALKSLDTHQDSTMRIPISASKRTDEKLSLNKLLFSVLKFLPYSLQIKLFEKIKGLSYQIFDIDLSH